MFIVHSDTLCVACGENETEDEKEKESTPVGSERHDGSEGHDDI